MKKQLAELIAKELGGVVVSSSELGDPEGRWYVRFDRFNGSITILSDDCAGLYANEAALRTWTPDAFVPFD